MNLFEFQIPHVDSLSAALLKYGAALDASDLGTGKTPCALFVAKKLGLRFGVVCLKSGVANWRRTAAEIGVQPSFVINYERLRAGNTGLGKFVETAKKGETVFVWKIDGPFLIIWDEFHCCKATDSLNAKMALAAKPLFNLMLSATVASSPLEMRALGCLLGLHDGHRLAAVLGFKDFVTVAQHLRQDSAVHCGIVRYQDLFFFAHGPFTYT